MTEAQAPPSPTGVVRGDRRPEPTGEVHRFFGTERSSVDTMLRNTQQQLVALSGQADLKASLLITAAAVVASVAATAIKDTLFGWAAGTLLVFVLGAMLAGVFAVLPKFRIHHAPEEHLPAHINPLFFGDYARLPKERYLDAMENVLRSDGKLYETIVSDLHDQGVYLVNSKYRYLRIAYVLYLAGFGCAAIALGVTALVT
ncbi:MAG TPA: Pycsar system effector family protein [Acidimicrobiia bacterium]|nr:Pycsar system effector family protein [Acidimicrobiia bacterium]